jgi:flagellar assembly factor FliW
VYEFPAGLYAFAGARRFALVPAGREGLFWLQSLDDAALVFLLADPFAHRADYVADLPDADVGALGATGAPGELAVLAIVTLPAERGGTPTVNLRAPVVLHAHTRLGRQLVLQDDRWGMTEPGGPARRRLSAGTSERTRHTAGARDAPAVRVSRLGEGPRAPLTPPQGRAPKAFPPPADT